MRATVEDKADYCLNFYRHFNRFIGEYLLHLDEEERKILPVLEEHFSAEELIGVMFAFKTYRENDTPEKIKEFIQQMLHPLTINDMNSLYTSIKKHTPPTLFTAVCHLSKEVIEPEQWAKLERKFNKND